MFIVAYRRKTHNGFILLQVRSQVQDVVSRLLNDMPHLQIAIFAHGDYCDKDKYYVTKHIDFSTNMTDLCSFVKDVSGTDGGDEAECYELVLHEVQNKLSWNHAANKSLVMIGDAYPHAKDEEQNYLHLDWEEEVKKLYKEVDITSYIRYLTYLWRYMCVVNKLVLYIKLIYERKTSLIKH